MSAARLFVKFVLFICGRSNWSVTLREEHRMRVFENRVLRKMCQAYEGGKNRRLEKIS